MQNYTRKQITQLRHTLHQYPDLSMQETGTMDILSHFLREQTSLEICERDGWFYALKRAGDKAAAGRPVTDKPAADKSDSRSGCTDRTYMDPPAEAGACSSSPIAFRADMDALPIPETVDLPYGSVHAGVSHKCGHDGHCAALCGLALELDRLETDRDVYLIFQPGEEIGAGATMCKDLIREKGISEIYAFHNLGGYPEGSIVYRKGLTQPASEGLRIRLTGKASHASAPEKGRNPAAVLAQIVLFAQNAARGEAVSTGPGAKDTGGYSLSRTVSSGMRLCTITGLQLGGGSGDFGISPGEGEVCMTLRAEAEEDMKAMEGAVLDFAGKTAAGAGLRMEYSIHDYFPETRNHDACLQKVIGAAKKLRLPVTGMEELWRASEDFGYYLKECPGAMFYIGNGENYPALHTVEYDFNDRILERAVDLFVELVKSEKSC